MLCAPSWTTGLISLDILRAVRTKYVHDTLNETDVDMRTLVSRTSVLRADEGKPRRFLAVKVEVACGVPGSGPGSPLIPDTATDCTRRSAKTACG